MSETVALLKAAQVAILHPEVRKTAYGTVSVPPRGPARLFKKTKPEDYGEKSPRPSLWTWGLYIAGGASFILNGVAIYMMDTLTTLIAGVVAIGVSLLVLSTQANMDSLGTFRLIHNKLRDTVNECMTTNIELTKNMNALQLKVGGLKVVEEKFEEVAKRTYGADLGNFKALVKENREITDQQKILIKGDAMQEMMCVLLQLPEECGKDKHFSEVEINRLMHRMDNIAGVRVNEKLLRAQVGSNRTIANVLDLLGDIDNDNGPDECIFFIDEKECEQHIKKKGL